MQGGVYVAAPLAAHRVITLASPRKKTSHDLPHALPPSQRDLRREVLHRQWFPPQTVCAIRTMARLLLLRLAALALAVALLAGSPTGAEAKKRRRRRKKQPKPEVSITRWCVKRK